MHRKAQKRQQGINLTWIEANIHVGRITTVLFLCKIKTKCFVESRRGSILWINEGMLHFIPETFKSISHYKPINGSLSRRNCHILWIGGWCDQFTYHIGGCHIVKALCHNFNCSLLTNLLNLVIFLCAYSVFYICWDSHLIFLF